MKIDGRALAFTIKTKLSKEVKKLKKHNIIPHLAVILVGNDPASTLYVHQKEINVQEIGGRATVIHLEKDVPEKELIAMVKKLNNDPAIHGIIVQRPLPSSINPHVINETTRREKDVDGFHTNPLFPMPIAAAVVKILEYVHSQDSPKTDFHSWLVSKKIVVVGKGQTGGGPVIAMLKKIGAIPIIVDTKTQEKERITRRAEIIISAVGKSKVITPSMVSKGVILISVGLHEDENGKLRGDYESKAIKDIVAYYTPSPGGMGPVNVAMLLENLLTAAKHLNSL